MKGRVDLLFLFHRLVILSSVQLSLLCRFFVFVFGLGARPMEPGASYLPPLPTLPSGGLFSIFTTVLPARSACALSPKVLNPKKKDCTSKPHWQLLVHGSYFCIHVPLGYPKS